MAEGFTANVSRPEDVTGSVPTHESVGSVVGGALGGLAKILDVGLKASAEARQDRILNEVDDKLYSEVNGWGPKAPGPILVGEKPEAGDQAALDSAPGVGAGMKKIGNLMSANKQGTMRTAEVMGRASTIVQEMIHNHPRFSDAIRERAQKILGTNPTESMIKLNEADEAMTREGNFRIQQKAIEDYQQTGGVMPIGADGQIDRPAAFALGQQATAANYTLDKTIKELDRDLKTQELYDKEHPKESPEAFHQRMQSTMYAGLDQKIQPQLDVIFRNYSNNPKLGALLGSTTGLGSAQETQTRLELQTGLNYNKAKIMSQVREALNKMPPDQRITPDIEAVAKHYEELFKPYEDALQGPLSSFKALTDAAAGLEARYKIDAYSSAKDLMRIKTMFGDAGMAQIANTQLTADMPLGKAANTAVFNAFSNILSVGSGQGDIPDADHGGMAVTKGLDNIYGGWARNPEALTEETAGAYQFSTSAIVRTGMGINDSPGQVQAATTMLLKPDRLALFDKFAAIKPNEAKGVGEQLLTLAQHNLQVQGANIKTYTKPDLVSSLTVNPLGAAVGALQGAGVINGRAPGITYGAQYNPTTGKVELTVLDASGKDQSKNPAAVRNLPQSLIGQINDMNQSMNAVTHLKQYGNDTDASMKEDEYKLGIISNAGIPVKANALTPSAKQAQKPAAAAAPEKKAETKESDQAINDVMSWEDPGLTGKITEDSGGKTKYGISQKAHPGLDIDSLTPEDAQKIYDRDYLKPLGEVPTGFTRAALDSSINQGVAKTKQWLSEAKGDIKQFIKLRRADYVKTAMKNPEKYGGYLEGWLNRLDRLQ